MFAIFVAQSFHIGRKIFVSFAIFAKFADISEPFLTFSLSKCRIFFKFAVLAIFAIFDVAQSFHIGRKFLLLLQFLRNLRTSRSPSWPFLFVKVEFWKICYSCYFGHICYSIFSHSKKNSSYFYHFCDVCYFFYTFLIAVSENNLLANFANKIDPEHKWTRVCKGFILEDSIDQ